MSQIEESEVVAFLEKKGYEVLTINANRFFLTIKKEGGRVIGFLTSNAGTFSPWTLGCPEEELDKEAQELVENLAQEFSVEVNFYSQSLK